MRRRIQFRDFLTWKVLTFLRDEGLYEVQIDLSAHPDADEKVAMEVVRQWQEFGEYIDENLGRMIEPLTTIPPGTRSKIILELFARALSLPVIPPSNRATFAIRTTRCVLRYFGVRMKTDAFSGLSALVQPVADQVNGNAASLRSIKRSLQTAGMTGAWADQFFKAGEPDMRDFGAVDRFRNEHEHGAESLSEWVRKTIVLASG